MSAKTHNKNNRDYDLESKDTDNHQYAYNFDFDVMHGYMVKSFKPYFKKGNVLELGSFEGKFTQRLLPLFNDITCVEASDKAIKQAQQGLAHHPNVRSTHHLAFINDCFEKVCLPKKYDNIIMTHVLEHIDDPVALLTRINNEWLTDDGLFFLVCPNANAASRQIAVKMGLISHNTAVTPAEEKHGHRCTYTLETLKKDVINSGLQIEKTEGIFFKALANFQWDQLLQTEIVSKEYLDGCYQLGLQYPDLCSSLFVMCSKKG